MLLSTIIQQVALLWSVSRVTKAYKWPDTKHDALEKLIYEGSRADGTFLFSFLNHCGLNFPPFPDDPPHNVTTTAATWLRLAYHDMSTFNSTDGTGGLDSSIYYELDREENVGSGLRITMLELSFFCSKHISRSDVIAIGAAMAVADCGGPVIPLRGGRTDATGAGLPGVPEPHQDLQTHTEKFKLQGFNSTEMIEMVACGHTLGGVESVDFPTIVDQPPGLPNGISESAAFDGTTTFDIAVVSQYLNGTTLNPLVSGRNETTRSDLRIFSSDGNVTMKALSNPSVFRERCSVLFERMLNTVPTGVQLTEVIDLIPVKPQQAGLRIVNDTLTFFTALRIAHSVKEPSLDPSRVSLYWCDRFGDASNCQSGRANRLSGASLSTTPINSPILTGLGKAFQYYYFQAPINATQSVSHFWFEVTGGTASDTIPTVYNNGGANYPLLQDDIFILPALTDIVRQELLDNGTTVNTHFVVAGVKEDPKPDRVYLDAFDNTHVDVPVGTITIATADFALNETLPGVPGYNIYTTHFDMIGSAPTADLHVDAGGKTSTLEYHPIGFQRDGLNMYTQVPLRVPEVVQI